MSADFLNRLFSLSGQSAVVIGGTGVVGGAIAEGLARAGAYVIVAGKNVQRGYQRVDVLRALASQGGFLPVDVTSRDSMGGLLDAAFDECGVVDMLVNFPSEEFSADELQSVEDHFKSVQLACEAFAPKMARQEHGGAILNIDVTGDDHTIIAFTRRLAVQYAPRGVRINAICPGPLSAVEDGPLLVDQSGEQAANPTPMARAGHPDELVGAALLLLSRSAGSFITGAALPIDGGLSAQ
jgi:NAD(P)-dependent dehydrogenase (short-subunit alcohol dehydrogenase family)